MEEGRYDNQRLRIDDLVLDPGTRRIYRSEEVIELPRLSWRLLMTLVNAAPDIVTHDELCDRVWPGRVVGPETLTQRIKLLRRSLGDAASEPRYIGAARGVGYRLLPEVKVADTATIALARRSHRAWLGVAVTAVIAVVAAGVFYWNYDEENSIDQLPSVAVLPFNNLSDVAGDVYLSDGISRELRDRLSRLSGLRVAALSSSGQFRESDADIVSIAEDLNVRQIVAGSLQRSGSTLQVTVQLLDGDSGELLWSSTYAENVIRTFAMQKMIAQDLAGELLPGIVSTNVVAVSAPSSAGYDLRLLGDHYFDQVRAELFVDMDLMVRVVDLYRRATAADPESAIAHARLAAALLYAGDAEGAEGPISRARSLNANLSDVQFTLGLYLWQRHLPGSGDAYARAIELEPNNVEALSAYAIWNWTQGRWTEPQPYFRKALELDPLTVSRYLDIGNFYGIGGFRDEALDIIRIMEDRFDSAIAYQAIARIYETIGEFEQAIKAGYKALQQAPEDKSIRWLLAELYARLGDVENAQRIDPGPSVSTLYFSRRYKELIEFTDELLLENPNQDLVRFALARAHSATGNFRLTVYLLEFLDFPNAVYVDSRRSNAIEALVNYADALTQLGQVERARDMAEWVESFMQASADDSPNVSWWVRVHLSCSQSILGKDAAALRNLEIILESPGLPWYPIIRDQPCFTKFADSPRYQKVLETLDRRRAELRSRVPRAPDQISVQ